jgi:hypothetical protein
MPAGRVNAIYFSCLLALILVRECRWKLPPI